MLLLETYESLLSRTKEGSDVWKINHSNGSPVVVSDETAQLIQTALDYSVRSDGAFDITIAPLLDLWDFKPEQHEGTVPDADQIQEALSHVDYKNVQLDGTTQTCSIHRHPLISAASQRATSQTVSAITSFPKAATAP